MKTIRGELKRVANEEKASVLMRFFKTGKGEYGEEDIFVGVTVPETRKAARTFLDTPVSELIPSLKSPYHEERLTALLVLVEKYKKAKTEKEKKVVVDFYLKNKYAVNNWDLVDLTADKILGNYLIDKDRKILYHYIQSKNLWERRMAVIATFAFIRKNDFNDTFKLCEKLLTDKHDLIHKACGWMLREIGKRDEKALEAFLKKHVQRMPRTMLRYAIERFPEKKRKAYLNHLG
jgi:3-methyladenine DNA glycosylase AlkD